MRDALYVNGGLVTTIIEVLGNNANFGGVYVLNLSRSFNTSSNDFSALFTMLPGSMAGTYLDGTMFTNNDELYLYGYVRLNGFTL